MTGRHKTLALGAALLLGVLVQVGRADDDISGTYELTGRQRSGFFGLGPRIRATLWVSREASGYRVAHTFTYNSDGRAGETLSGTGRLSGDRLEVTFPSTAGLTDALTGAAAGGSGFRAQYRVRDGKIDGWCEGRDRGGRTRRFNEKGRSGDARPWPGEQPTTPEPTTPQPTTSEPTTPEPTTPTTSEPAPGPGDVSGDVRVDRPVTGRVFLVGQTIPLTLVPADATLAIEGPARREGQGLVITSAGRVTLRASHAGQTSSAVAIEAVTAEVVEVTVEDGIAIQDARAPHWRRTPPAMEPAAMVKDRPLRVALTLKAARSLSEPAQVRLVGAGGGAQFDETVTVRDLQQGHVVRVGSRAPLSRAVAVNALDVTWTLAGQGAGRTPLRVYTVLATPVENPMPKYAPSVRPVNLATKLHFELACTWANGASRNVGAGAESICFQLDNHFAHHVHPRDYRGAPPFVPAYGQGARQPVNYADLPGSILDGGRRSASSGLYYPPLEPTKDYQEYHHYAGNFGWWVLDNPEYTGGRCNQQASLIADIFGTVGVQARVYYIERVARGKRTGRPMRRYYKSSRSERSWNFHGVCEATLEGGVKWLYDGSGSYPTRINGKTEDLMKVPDGPFVDFWHPWSYEDVGGAAPRDDWPDRWEGVPLQAGEQYP